MSNLPNPVGKFTKTSFLEVKSFTAFFYWGKSLETPNTRQAFSKSTVNIYINISGSFRHVVFTEVHSSGLWKCNIPCYWWKFRQSTWRQEQAFLPSISDGEGSRVHDTSDTSDLDRLRIRLVSKYWAAPGRRARLPITWLPYLALSFIPPCEPCQFDISKSSTSSVFSVQQFNLCWGICWPHKRGFLRPLLPQTIYLLLEG